MLDSETKARINTARDILVGKVPDPKSQVEQITIALIYKFMDDMDLEAEELGGKRTFFSGEYAKYSWRKIFDPRQSGHELLNLYSEAIDKMDVNPGVPKLFRDIFKNAYLPYRDPETLKSFLKIINEFEYSHSEKLGDAFEFLLSILGSQGDAGQFRTPRHIIDFMVQIMDPKKHEIILDPACGTAGFLISSYKHIIKQNSTNYSPEKDQGIDSEDTRSVNEVILTTNGYTGDKLTATERSLLADNMHGYDISPDMVRLSLVNMYLHGVKEPRIFEYDSLTSEDHWNEFSDVILANPPFMSPKGGIRPHKRFTVQSNRSEVLFVDYIAEHLTQDGRAAVIVPEGIIFQSGNAYKQLRKMLVEKYLVGVISLPAGVFQPYSGVKTSILWLDKSLAKKSDKILFMKISNDGYDLGAQRRAIKGNDLPSALQEVRKYKEVLKNGRVMEVQGNSPWLVVPKVTISKNDDFILTVDRYKTNIIQKTSNFDLVEIGDLCELVNGRPFKPEDWETIEKGGLPIIRIQNLNHRHSTFNYFSGETIEKYLVEPEELLFSWSGSKGTSFGAHIWCGGKAILNQHIFKVKFDRSRAIKKYLYYALNLAVEEVEQNLHGGVGLVHITKGNLERIKIPLPSLHIQESIVAEIDGYQKIIDGARQVAENYKPRIDIDPAWEMVIISQVCTIQAGGTPSRAIPEYWNGSIPWVGSTVCKDVDVNIAEEHITEEGLKNSAAKVFESGTTLIALVGATIGKTGFLTFPCSTNQNIAGLYPKDRDQLDIKYLFFVSQTLYPKFMQLGEGKFRMANLSFIRALEIPLPPLQKQIDVVRKIETELSYVNGNKNLVHLFEQKIKDRLAKVWGE